MHEIEVKLKFEDKEKIVSKLKSLGAKFREKYELTDIYFSLKHNDMKNAHDLIRIRKKGDKAELTFKGKCETESHIWKRIELTTNLGDSEAMLQILGYLKFNKILENKSLREYWDLADTEIAFISLIYPAKIDFIEIEALSEEKVQKVLDELKGLAEVVGEDYFKKLDEVREKAKAES
ncbi:class IV adenylate cyclase [Candidatus Pacearchaeota archaeon]|nr:class IV adenylate cyclase [Candidatus Pacearchaeota archaeon]